MIDAHAQPIPQSITNSLRRSYRETRHPVPRTAFVGCLGPDRQRLRYEKTSLSSPLVREKNKPYQSCIIFNSNQIHSALGSMPFFRPWDDRLLRRVSKPPSNLLHPVLLHLPGFLVRGTNIPFSDHGMCACILEYISSFVRQVVYPQCKHVLATLIGQRLSKFVVREMNKDDFTTLLAGQTSDP